MSTRPDTGYGDATELISNTHRERCVIECAS
jgi:hypothetical protein